MKKFILLLFLTIGFSGIAQQKLEILSSPLYLNAKKGNNEKVLIALQLTDQNGASVNAIGPMDVKLYQTNFIESNYSAHFVLLDFTTTANKSGMFYAWVEPPVNDVWKKGEHVFEIIIQNANYKGSTFVVFKF